MNRSPPTLLSQARRLSFSTADILAMVLMNGISIYASLSYPLHYVFFFFRSLQTYGAMVDQLKAEIGAPVSQSAVEAALKTTKYKILTVTHVDTSTGIIYLTLIPPF
jgi:hypothetical protein